MTAKNMFQSNGSSNHNRDNELESQEVLKALSMKLSISSSTISSVPHPSKYDCVTNSPIPHDSSRLCFRGRKRSRDFDDIMFVLQRASPIIDEDDDEDDWHPEPKRARSSSGDFEGREDDSTFHEMRSESPNSPLLWEDLVIPDLGQQAYLLMPEIDSSFSRPSVCHRHLSP
jgi:hypothetical protein